MARPKLPAGVRSVLLAVAVGLAVAQTGTAYKQPEPSTTPSRLPPLVDCGPALVAPPAAESDAFRTNVLSLLHSITAAAAASGEFVTARSGGTGRDRAFVRASCFGGANSSSSSVGGCRACLSAAAREATRGCAASRRAGVWRAGCFLGYADTDAMSAREEEFRGWFYATTAATLEDRVCAGERTGADCDRCFKDAARAAAALPWLVRMRGEEVIVVGYDCCLRVRISVLPMGSENDTFDIRQALFSLFIGCWIGFETAIVAGLLLRIIRTLQAIPQPIQ